MAEYNSSYVLLQKCPTKMAAKIPTKMAAKTSHKNDAILSV